MHLAKQWDAAAPEEIRATKMLSGCNPHLADAYNWLATAESRLGKAAEAEAHHGAAFKAVEDLGLVDTSNRRVSKDWG